MRVIEQALGAALLLEPVLYRDARGHFFESFNAGVWATLVGDSRPFVQDNQSLSARNVLRGLHYQITQPQGKLVTCLQGALFDVCVDLRRASPTFGQWVGWELSEQNHRLAWIPEGFAHGFLVLSEQAKVLYKTTDFWSPQGERILAWNDPDLAIAWPLQGAPVLSARDAQGLRLSQAEVFD